MVRKGRPVKRSLYFTDRKRYYRNKKAREYYQKRKTATRKTRTRRQVVFNCDYSMSIRAIQINGNADLKELEKRIEEFLDSNEPLKRINWSTEGFEDEEIDATEDKGLSNGKIYLEVNLKGEVTITEL